jgi:hypothetical protein
MNMPDHATHAPAGADDPSAKPDPGDQQKRDANALMMTGAGIGAFGAVAAAIGGAVCPVCVVAAPALLAVGAFRRWRATRARTTGR